MGTAPRPARPLRERAAAWGSARTIAAASGLGGLCAHVFFFSLPFFKFLLFFLRRLSGYTVRFIGLCENVKIKTSLSGIKYTPEINFLGLFAQFLVDKLHITPKGETSLAYCVHKVGFTLAQRNHIRKETVKSF